ncbi:MAG: hypothetical protein HY551_05325 [Elusimicrobia bacterium]|nr:hypothetical protein [Elusimicrobiota bacterium]
MDVVSHATWGYLSLRRAKPELAKWGALAGAAPDMLYFIPFALERSLRDGTFQKFPTGLSFVLPRMRYAPGIWRENGPPMPQELVDAYHSYYVYTHSLVILGLAVGALWLLRRRRRLLWLTIPYALHILMDIPTHERYLTPFLYPISMWTFKGISWGHPWIFWPNWIALAGTGVWLYWKSKMSTFPDKI